jgi:hypothetical protein
MAIFSLERGCLMNVLFVYGSIFGCIPLTVFCLSAFCLLIALRGFSMGGPTGFFVSQGSHLEIAIKLDFWYK